MLADNAESDLPTLVDLAPGEALDAYLERVATANYLTTARLLDMVRTGHGTTTTYLMLAPSSSTIDRIAHLTGTHPDALRGATLATYHGTTLDLRGLDPTRPASFRAVSARGWIPGHGTQICPACLAQDGIWRTTWRLPTTTVCRTHGVYLLSTCPGCGRPFRDQRHSPLRVVGAAPRCGNPLGQGPRQQCRIDLTTLPAEPADAACRARQIRQDTADAGGSVTTFAGPLEAVEYTATLRSLTALLLHIATAARDSTALPPWTHAIAAADSGSERRWFLRPPDDPVLRSRALSSADHILAADDFDAAVSRFIPWLGHTPAVPEGRLGWVADHTRMTLTLTRLVITSHAPRRRLSHLLDQTPPLTASTRQIPQVLPTRLVDEHLAGLFESRPDTVGLFASLCIARTHPHVRSWTDAARELDLPAELGERAARACSATMTGSPTEVAAALAQAARSLEIDYRAMEDRVQDLAGTKRWFRRWVRHNRPGSRPGSRAYALHWLWLEVAHGHPTTVPVPAHAWSYRKFARLITEGQAATLAGAIATSTQTTLESR